MNDEVTANGSSNTMTYLVSAIVLVVACAGVFYGGMRYQESRTPDVSAQFPGFPGGNGQRPGGRNGTANAGTFANGEVISKDDQSITIKLQDGGSKIVYFSGTTTIGKTTAGATSDLTTGIQVVATGSSNTDGSIAAQSIQIRPANDSGAPLGGMPPDGAPPANSAGN